MRLSSAGLEILCFFVAVLTTFTFFEGLQISALELISSVRNRRELWKIASLRGDF